MAGLKKVVVLNVAVLVLLLAVSASADMVDFFKLLNPKNQEFSVKTLEVPACCDNCICTKSIPPQCTCSDEFIGTERCESCESCYCTRSIPPQCRCADVKDYCHPPCADVAIATEAMLEHVFPTVQRDGDCCI